MASSQALKPVTPVAALSTITESQVTAAFPVLAFDQSELTELIKDNLGGSLPKLPRIPWPTGGNTEFKIETDEGEQKVDNLTGLVVHHVVNRVFWVQSFDESGGGAPTDCQSPDGMNGYGRPMDPKTGQIHPMLKANPALADTNPEFAYACSQCPLARFTGENKPRCSERHPLFIVLRAEGEDDLNLLPIILSVPPSSLSIWANFSGQLLSKGISFRRAIVEVTLETLKGGPSGKIDYSSMKVRRVGTLTREQFAFMRKYAQDLEPLFTRFDRQAVDSAFEEEAAAAAAKAAEDRDGVRKVVVTPDQVDPGSDGSSAFADDFEPIVE